MSPSIPHARRATKQETNKYNEIFAKNKGFIRIRVKVDVFNEDLDVHRGSTAGDVVRHLHAKFWLPKTYLDYSLCVSGPYALPRNRSLVSYSLGQRDTGKCDFYLLLKANHSECIRAVQMVTIQHRRNKLNLRVETHHSANYVIQQVLQIENNQDHFSMFSLSYKGRPVGFRRLLECVHEVDSRASPRTVVEMAPSRNKALPVEPGQRARLLKTKKDGLVGLSVYLNSKQHMLQLTEDATPRSLLLEFHRRFPLPGTLADYILTTNDMLLPEGEPILNYSLGKESDKFYPNVEIQALHPKFATLMVDTPEGAKVTHVMLNPASTAEYLLERAKIAWDLQRPTSGYMVVVEGKGRLNKEDVVLKHIHWNDHGVHDKVSIVNDEQWRDPNMKSVMVRYTRSEHAKEKTLEVHMKRDCDGQQLLEQVVRQMSRFEMWINYELYLGNHKTLTRDLQSTVEKILEKDVPLIVKRKLYNGSVVRLQMGASWHNFKSDEPQMNVLVEAGKYMRIKVPQCLNIVVATCSGVLNLHTEQSIGEGCSSRLHIYPPLKEPIQSECLRISVSSAAYDLLNTSIILTMDRSFCFTSDICDHWPFRREQAKIQTEFSSHFPSMHLTGGNSILWSVSCDTEDDVNVDCLVGAVVNWSSKKLDERVLHEVFLAYLTALRLAARSGLRRVSVMMPDVSAFDGQRRQKAAALVVEMVLRAVCMHRITAVKANKAVIEEVTLLYDSDSPYKEEMLVRLNANGNPIDATTAEIINLFRAQQSAGPDNLHLAALADAAKPMQDKYEIRVNGSSLAPSGQELTQQLHYFK